MAAIRIALVGIGKIARDQHLPAIAANPDFALTAVVSRVDPGLDAPYFPSLEALLAHGPVVDAVALCTPPQVRYGLAAAALARGLHVFLEKPPGATLAEVELLRTKAERHGASLFASWHSRHAAGVQGAKAWLAQRAIGSVRIIWREDVRLWHPNQAWIWEAGGLGVFDPGINALSIATEILPRPFFLTKATLFIPANREAPIAADLAFTDHESTPIVIDLDWRQTGPQSWDIIVETDAGALHLAKGGAVLTLPEGEQIGEDREYPSLYARFAALVRARESEVDVAPLRHVADAFLRGRRVTVDPFVD
jgi:D-galactose 1-dehydrogenase